MLTVHPRHLPRSISSGVFLFFPCAAMRRMLRSQLSLRLARDLGNGWGMVGVGWWCLVANGRKVQDVEGPPTCQPVRPASQGLWTWHHCDADQPQASHTNNLTSYWLMLIDIWVMLIGTKNHDNISQIDILTTWAGVRTIDPPNGWFTSPQKYNLLPWSSQLDRKSCWRHMPCDVSLCSPQEQCGVEWGGWCHRMLRWGLWQVHRSPECPRPRNATRKVMAFGPMKQCQLDWWNCVNHEKMSTILIILCEKQDTFVWIKP